MIGQPRHELVALVEQLLDGDLDRALTSLEEPRNRRALGRALTGHQPLLERLYASSNARVRFLALATSDPEIARAAIDDEEAVIRARATDVLVKERDLRLLTDSRASVRLRLLKKLRFLRLGPEIPLNEVADLLDDPDPSVAGLAAIIVQHARPAEPRLVNAFIRYLAVADESCELADSLGQLIAAQPQADAAVGALCGLLRNVEPPGRRQWPAEAVVPYRSLVVASAWRGAVNLEVARAFLTCLLEDDARIGVAAVHALRLAPRALAPHLQPELARASCAKRARLLVVMARMGETSHSDAIRKLIACDDTAPWGASEDFEEVEVSAPLRDAFERVGCNIDTPRSNPIVPARWVGGLLAILARPERSSDFIPELRIISERCEDPVVRAAATRELERVQPPMPDLGPSPTP